MCRQGAKVTFDQPSVFGNIDPNFTPGIRESNVNDEGCNTQNTPPQCRWIGISPNSTDLDFCALGTSCIRDQCSVCSGNNTSCAGCDNIPWSSASLVNCDGDLVCLNSTELCALEGRDITAQSTLTIIIAAAAAVGGLLLIVVVIGIVVLKRRRTQKNQSQSEISINLETKPESSYQPLALANLNVVPDFGNVLIAKNEIVLGEKLGAGYQSCVC